MKNLLRLEELAQLLVCIAFLAMNAVPWWAYLLLALGPDIGMLGYLIGTRVGAFTYNVLHHKGLALLLMLGGQYMGLLSFASVGAVSHWRVVMLTGLILFGHSSMDRMLGYGLKFGDSFQHTHLGWIGKAERTEAKA